jgi:hypothetical protein
VHEKEGEEGADPSGLAESFIGDNGELIEMGDEDLDGLVDYEGGAGDSASSSTHNLLINSRGEYVGYTGNESFGSGYNPQEAQGHSRTASGASGDFGLQEWIHEGSDEGDNEGSSEPRAPGSERASVSSGSPPAAGEGEEADKELNMEADDVYGMHAQPASGTDIGMSLNMFGGENGLGMGMGMGNMTLGGMRSVSLSFSFP